MDWKSTIAELDALGVNQPQIAAACGCSQGTISLLARGVTKDPKYSLGMAIQRLLAQKRGEAAEKAVATPAPVLGAAGAVALAAGG